MDPLERELRDLLTSDRRDLPASLVPLDRVHAGASRRRRRRAAVASAATAVAVLAVAGTAAGAGFLRDDKAPVADSTPTVSRSIVPAPVPTSTAPDTTINAPSGPAWGGSPGHLGHSDEHPHVRRPGRARRHRRLHAAGLRAPGRDPRRRPDLLRAPRPGRRPRRGGRADDRLRAPACGSAAPRTAGSSAAGSGPPTTAATRWTTGHDAGTGRASRGGGRHGLGAGADPRRRACTLWRSPVGTDDWTQVTERHRSPGPRTWRCRATGSSCVGAQDSDSWVGGTDGFAEHASPCPAHLQTELSSVGAFWVDVRAPGSLARLAVSPDGATWSDVADQHRRSGAVPEQRRHSGHGPTARPWSARASTRRSRGCRQTAR